MMKSVFEFDDYKAFIKSVEKSRSELQRGFRTRLAEAAQCQSAFVSQVLNTSAHFSLEQGLKITRFLNLDRDGSQFFILLLEHNRAGTKDLKDFFSLQLESQREKLLSISKRVGAKNLLSEEARATFYSRWYYSAIHVLPSIKKYQTVEEIASILELPKSIVQSAVLFLVTHELLEEKNGNLKIGPSQLHLSKDSPHIFNHHANWRLKALQDFEDGNRDIHYSAISTLSAYDAEKLKVRMVDFIQEYVKSISASVPEEKAYAFTLDFFQITRK